MAGIIQLDGADRIEVLEGADYIIDRLAVDALESTPPALALDPVFEEAGKVDLGDDVIVLRIDGRLQDPEELQFCRRDEIRLAPVVVIHRRLFLFRRSPFSICLKRHG